MTSLLLQIGFTPEQAEKCCQIKKSYGTKLDGIRKDYVEKRITNAEAFSLAKAALNDIHPYTAELMLVLECLPDMKRIHEEKNIPEKVFLDSARDITYKIKECQVATGIFGIMVGWWYDRFIFATRLTFSRLQYDVNVYEGERVEYQGNVLEKGDFVLDCHIHSGSRLLEEECISSYREAWEFFRNNTKNSVLPIICWSWLLYPDYLKVFGEESNTGRFARHFHIYRVDSDEKQISTVLSRVFDTFELSDTLPENTSMQRRFKEYFKTSNSYGNGAGIIFFDGENVLTRR